MSKGSNRNSHAEFGKLINSRLQDIDLSGLFADILNEISQPSEHSEAKMSHAFFSRIANFMQSLDASMSNPSLGGLVGQSYTLGAVQAHNQQISDVTGARYARCAFLGTSERNQLAVRACEKLLAHDKNEVLCDANVHISISAGLEATGQKVTWINHLVHPETGVQQTLTCSQIETLLSENPRLGLVIVTSPGYNGDFIDVLAIKKTCVDFGVKLMVDNAWSVGAALGILGFPKHAVLQGADLCTISLHKKGVGLSQYACVLSNDDQFIEAFDELQALCTTTSPSYLNLALSEVLFLESVFGARREQWDALPGLCNELRHQLNSLHEAISVMSTEDFGAYALDPTHITIQLKGFDGYLFQSKLATRGILVEKATPDTLMLLVSGKLLENNTRNWLLLQFKEVLQELEFVPGRVFPSPPPLLPEHIVMTLREAYRAQRVGVPLEFSVGHTAGQSASPYPPGIPVIQSGMIITQAAVDYIYLVSRLGGRVRGLNMSDPIIQVITEQECNHEHK